MLVKTGFTLSDIAEMTIPQIQVYTSTSHKRSMVEHINIMGLQRVAYHAQDKEYQDLVRNMEA